LKFETGNWIRTDWINLNWQNTFTKFQASSFEYRSLKENGCPKRVTFSRRRLGIGISPIKRDFRFAPTGLFGLGVGQDIPKGVSQLDNSKVLTFLHFL